MKNLIKTKMIDNILLIAKKEVKKRFFLSLVIGIIFGFVSALPGSFFWHRSQMISFGISILILNFALFLLGANIISEEKTEGTLSFLLTLPLKNIEIIFGKLLGLIVMMAPGLLINVLGIIFFSYNGRFIDFDFTYPFALFLYLLFSASLLILASCQVQRLPAIFLIFIFYNMTLAIPGAFWFSKTVSTSYPAFIFPIVIFIFSFFTPLFFGISEYLSSEITLLIPIIQQNGGGETIFSIFEKLPESLDFTIVNLFSPIWQSSLLMLESNEISNKHSFLKPISIFSTFFMVFMINILASFQLRQGVIKIVIIFLLISFIPLFFGYFVYV